MKTIIDEEKDNFKKMQDASFGSWYYVTFIPNYLDFQCNKREMQTTCIKRKLRLDNINGWGNGTLFFATKGDKLLVLNWASIISMIPIE